MTFEQWLEAKGLEVTDENREVLKATFEAEVKAGVDGGNGGEVPPPLPEPPAIKADAVKDMRGMVAAEERRIGTIQALARKYKGQGEVVAKAVEEGWTAERAELEMLRAARPSEVYAGQQDKLGPAVLEAAVRLSGVEKAVVVEKAYNEEVLDRASQLRFMGLRDLIATCCRIDGRQTPQFGANPTEWLQAAFSTTTLSGVLGNTANKVLLDAYRATPMACTQVSRKLTANDFKTHTGYRLTGDMTLEELSAAGEIKHAALNEDSFTFSVDTYGKMLVLTRKEIVNDDLNAFTQLPQAMGRGAALKAEKLFWTLVLANTGSFFSAGNVNYFSGATSALASSSLSTAVQMLREQTDADGNPILISPIILCVPPALEQAATELYVSSNIVEGGGSTRSRAPDKNIHQNKYRPVITAFLSNTTFHASASDTAWYLFGDPQDAAAFGVAYLRGNETPTFEAVTLDNNVLGAGWRIYWDVGVCQIDKRGAVMSKGAA